MPKKTRKPRRHTAPKPPSLDPAKVVDPGIYAILNAAIRLAFVLAQRSEEQKHDEGPCQEPKRDKKLPEEGEVDIDKLIDWFKGLVTAFSTCDRFLDWLLQLVSLILRWQLTPPGNERDQLRDQIKSHLQDIGGIVKISRKTDKDVDDPYHWGDFDTRTCIFFSVCGQSLYDICIWQDVGAITPELMITLSYPDGREEVIFWYD